MTDPHEPEPGDTPRFPAAPPPPPAEVNESGSWPAPPVAPAATPQRPIEVVISFWGWVVAAVLLVVGALLDLGRRRQVLDALRDANLTVNGPRLSEAQLQQIANVTIGVSVGITVIIGLLYVLFAVKAAAGRNWARIVLTIIAVLALLGLVSRGNADVISYAGEVVAVVSAVLLYLPNSSAYIAAVKRERARPGPV